MIRIMDTRSIKIITKLPESSEVGEKKVRKVDAMRAAENLRKSQRREDAWIQKNYKDSSETGSS